ncbi:hypothetical protein [Burkholderia guangdongensis]|uniref:hypothetical protein n=1 Tax=Burkholderia guangdongensis TaxID=1792500 RepID=UPI0015C7AE55|nr:hypothetical protein [Burkholderia guangdongensis]
MTWSEEDELELRHIDAMIGQLGELDPGARAASSTVVLQTAYWRARVDALRRKQPDNGRAAMLVKALLARLDALDARPRGDADTVRARRRGRRA